MPPKWVSILYIRLITNCTDEQSAEKPVTHHCLSILLTFDTQKRCLTYMRIAKAQIRLRKCALAQSDQRLSCSHVACYDTEKMKTVTRLQRFRLHVIFPNKYRHLFA